MQQYSPEEIQQIQLKEKTVTLRIKDFTDLDTEELLQVDYNNIIGDLITFPVLFNRISNLKAEIEDLYDRTKLELDVLEADKYLFYKKDMVVEKEIITSSGKETGKFKVIDPTGDMVDAAVKKDKEIISKKLLLLDIKKQVKIIDGLYWAAQAKNKKLDTISAKMVPEEFENYILEGEVNSVLIKFHNNVV